MGEFQIEGFLPVKASEKDGHQKSRHLIVGDVSCHIAGDEPVYFLFRKLTAFTFFKYYMNR